MRTLYYLFFFVSVFIAFWFGAAPDALPVSPKKSSKAQRIDGAIDNMLFTSRDIDLGYIPYEKLFDAIDEGQRRAASASNSRAAGYSLADARWSRRGPIDVGGRTRAIMIDEADPKRNRIWVGSVSGGVWRTEDITLQNPEWKKLTLQVDNLAISSIAQDPGNPEVIYVGTGEGFNNIDAVTGAGIFKSTDDGLTWEWLASTRGPNFREVNDLYVHSNGDVYALTTQKGMFRSKNGGGTWEKVLADGLSGATSNAYYDMVYVEANQTFYASSANSIFKSANGNRGEWFNIGTQKPGFPGNLIRTEIAICHSNPDVMYVIGSVDGSASNTYVTNDGGETWMSRESPGEFPGDDFTNGQAWYDLEIAVDPFNCSNVIAGGVKAYGSNVQGLFWFELPDNMHVDQHNCTFDPRKEGRVLFGNDGGVWLSEDGGQTIIDKNFGYVTTQFYCADIHPGSGSPYLLGGTQDNNSIKLPGSGTSPGFDVWGGDGMFCFIDQNEPHIQIVSRQFGRYGISRDGGNSFNDGARIEGDFINRSGYDDVANLLYGQVPGSDFFRWDINLDTFAKVDIAGQALSVSAVQVDPVTPNRIYFGSSSGRLIRVDNANTGDTVQGTLLRAFPGGVGISCVYVDKLNPDHILVSLFNFGASLENIWVSYDAGVTWSTIEGDLPDMPIRWALFDPADHNRVMIATEAGIWYTDDVNGNATQWRPIDPDNGMPFVKVEMLILRDSDKVVLAATHGCGLFTTDVFSDPPLPAGDQVVTDKVKSNSNEGESGMLPNVTNTDADIEISSTEIATIDQTRVQDEFASNASREEDKYNDLTILALPNPFTDKVVLQMNSPLERACTVRLMDCSGKIIRQETLLPDLLYYQIDHLELPSGLYLMHILFDNGQAKVIKLVSAGQ